MRVAIYSRMSTDKQNEQSPADQIAACRRFAESRGWTVVESCVAAEAGISGASRHNRPELLSLMDRIGEWDVLLCWDSSRLARNQEDLGWIVNRLRSHRRIGIEVSTGLDLFNIGAQVMGVMNEQYLSKLRVDTHRGLQGRAERKLATGGTPYGYRTEPEPNGGRRLVVREDEAAIVRRIFDLYLAGEGYRAIAGALNAERVPSPRGKGWAPTAIYALVRNPIYHGEQIWNRSEWVKDHETTRRRRHERPPEEWVRQTDESWRIVPEETWQRVCERAEQRGRIYRRSGDGRRIAGPRAGAGHRNRGRGMFSGLLECAECGGAFYGVKRADRLRCAWHVDRGAIVCPSDLTVARDELEARVLKTVREEVLTPETLAYILERAIGLARERLGRDDTGRARRRIRELEQQIERATLLAVRTGHVERVVQVIAELEAERKTLAAQLAGPTPIRLGDRELRRLAERWANDLRALFDETPDGVRRAFASLLAGRRMRVGRDAERGFRVEGVFELPWNENAPSEGASRGGATGSGGPHRPSLRAPCRRVRRAARRARDGGVMARRVDLRPA